MKKNLKILILGMVFVLGVLLIVMLLIENGTDKLVVTKKVENLNRGNYKEEVTITFDDNVINIVETSMEFENEEIAKSMYTVYTNMLSVSQGNRQGIKVKINGKKIIIVQQVTMDTSINGMLVKKMTKDQIKAAFEEKGYTVK